MKFTCAASRNPTPSVLWKHYDATAASAATTATASQVCKLLRNHWIRILRPGAIPVA